MTLADELAAIESGLGVMAVEAGDLLRLTGTEPLAALDRVVSQEVRSLRDGDARPALLLAPKGQFRAVMNVLHAGGEALVLAPPGRGPALAAMLDSYLRFSRVTVAPAGWSGGASLLLGPAWPEVAAALGADAARAQAGCAVAGGAGDRLLFVGETFAGVAGATVAAESGAAAERLAAEMRASGAVAVSAAALAAARIAAGFPAWGAELEESVLPPEVGIEATAISYTKGCYVGQETIARMRTYGHPNRRLVRLRQVEGPEEPPALPCDLYLPGEEKPKGRLASWALHPSHGAIALALVHRTVGEDAVLLCGARGFVPLTGPA